VENNRDIFDEFDEVASELENHHLIEEGELSTLRRLVNHHREVYEKPLGDPAYGEIAEMQALEDVLRMSRDMIEIAKKSALAPLDSHAFELLYKASKARADAARFEQEALDNYCPWRTAALC
jgi:hypothetical protein